MRTTGCVYLFIVAGAMVARPALSQTTQLYNAAVSFSCVAEDSTDSKEKLITIKGNNREIIALCNGVDPTDSDNNSQISTLMQEQAVVLDDNYELRVINRCSGSTICQSDLADGNQCSSAINESQNSSTEDGVCIIFPDSLTGEGTILTFGGSLRCKDQFTSKTKGETTTNGFQTGCVGYPSIGFNQFEETLPCTLNVSTGSPFQTPKNCPTD